MIPTFYGHREGGIDFADGADTFERLGFGMAGELHELMLKRSVVEHGLAEDGIEALGGYEGG